MIERDDRFYAFIVERTRTHRARIRRFSVHKRWLKLSAFLAAAVFCVALYGFYGLTQQIAHQRIEHENELLRAENQRQREQLNNLNQRVEAVEDATRRLAEMSGVEHPNEQHTQPQQQTEATRGAGGPAFPLDSLTAIEYKTENVEKKLRAFEAAMRERAVIPSIWPVEGELNNGLGVRRNPFGGSSYEFHTGLDIDAAYGAQILAAANGTVTFSGWQNGYGQIVIIDHGNGLTTRYGHMSRLAAVMGQSVKRGEVIGYVGSTGRSTGPHLHYEVRMGDQPVDPTQYLPAPSN